MSYCCAVVYIGNLLRGENTTAGVAWCLTSHRPRRVVRLPSHSFGGQVSALGGEYRSALVALDSSSCFHRTIRNIFEYCMVLLAYQCVHAVSGGSR